LFLSIYEGTGGLVERFFLFVADMNMAAGGWGMLASEGELLMA